MLGKIFLHVPRPKMHLGMCMKFEVHSPTCLDGRLRGDLPSRAATKLVDGCILENGLVHDFCLQSTMAKNIYTRPRLLDNMIPKKCQMIHVSNCAVIYIYIYIMLIHLYIF